MKSENAYLTGFKKAASDAGIDPEALVKFAQLGIISSAVNAGKAIWNATKATGGIAKAVAPAARNAYRAYTRAKPVVSSTAKSPLTKAWGAFKRTKALRNASEAAGAAWGAVPHGKALATAGTLAAGYGLGRMGGSSDDNQQQGFSPEQMQMMQQLMTPAPDYLGDMRTADAIPAVFNYRPYVPRWKEEQYQYGY